MKILLVKDEGTEADVIALAIESFQDGVTVQYASNPTEAIKLLDEKVVFRVVVAENKFSTGESCVDLYKQVLALNRETAFFLISDTNIDKLPFFASNPPTKLIKRPLEVSELMEAFSVINASENNSEYCKVVINTLLLSGEELKADLYIKLSEEKYIKALPEGSAFEISDYNRFLQKNIRHLYMKRDDLTKLLGRWFSKLEEARNANIEELGIGNVSNLIEKAHSAVQSALPLKGFTPELQKMAISSVNLAVKTIQTSPKLSSLIEAFNSQKIPYISSHSTALGLMASKLAFLMGWHSENTFYKLSMAAYLHDITLEEDDWARLNTKKEILESGLSKEICQKILKHPLEAALLAAKMEELPADIGHILEQHHELSDGSGFPRGITNKEISQISALFVLAHDMVTEMMRMGSKFDGRDFFRKKNIVEKFDRGSFSQIYRALRAKIDEELL